MTAGVEESPPLQRASPELCPPGASAPHAPPPAGPGSSAPDQGHPAKPGVRAAGATPAVEQARSPEQCPQAPRRLQRPRPGRCCWASVARGGPGVGCGAAGRAGTYLGGGVSSGDPPAASWRQVPPPSTRRRAPAAAAAAKLRHPDPPGLLTACRELRGPRRESGRARQPPTSLPHSLGRAKRRSASPKPSITPIGPTSALPSLTHAGGDGQDATAISARGEGRSSSAGPTEAAGRGETPPRAARPPPLSSPFSSRTDG